MDFHQTWCVHWYCEGLVWIAWCAYSSIFDRVICPWYICIFILKDNFREYQWIFTKLGVCIDIVEIWFGIADGQISTVFSRPRWLSWMRRPTGDQEVAGSTPAEVGNILSWRLIMKYILRSFSPFRWFKKGSCQFLAKECAQYWLTT